MPGWDQYTQDGSSFSQLPDEDFLTLLQKQFDETNSYDFYAANGGINPQTIQPFVMPEFSSPSDSSPSPPSASSNQPTTGARPQGSRRDSDEYADEAPAHKRKASTEEMDEEPTTKTPHTASHSRKASTGGVGPHRRKTTGASGEDNRLNKRKEQNRAAQRAFRERKEKHVKDLEDQVAELEAKNQVASSENGNLRDLLSRLQDENQQLKKQAFTFQVPKTQSSGPSSASSPSARSNSISSPLPFFTSTSPQSPISVSMPSTSSVTLPDNFTPDMDWSQLTNFDPSVLSLLDESPQMTATDTAMSMDFGFGSNDGQPFKSPFTTIAANPLFMSFSDFDSPSDAQQAPSTSTDVNNFKFDTNAWPSPITQLAPSPQSGLDQLLSGDFMTQQGSVDFNTLMRGSPSAAATLSPVARAQPFHPGSISNGSASGSGTSASSPSDSSTAQTSVSGESPAATTTPYLSSQVKTCPKTREESKAMMLSQGSSMFVKNPVEKLPDGETVGCKGSTFPTTQPNASNVDLLTAWRKVTSDPNYKNIDVNSLCSEFTQKARCDGSKMVVEPHSLEEITKSLINSQRH